MTKREILMDWLSLKENRDKLPYSNITAEELETFDEYGYVFKYADSSNVVCIGKTYYRIKTKQEPNEIQTAY